MLAMAQTLTSPDGKYVFSIDGMTYRVTYNKNVVVEKSQLGVEIDNRLFESALAVPRGTHENWCQDLVQKSAVVDTGIETT